MDKYMLDKRTFGNSPAAIFLADKLNELNDYHLTRQVSSFINRASKLINEAVRLHTDHQMSTTMLYFIVDNISRDVANKANDMQAGANGVVYNKVVCNLMANVLRGQIKSIKRRLEKVVRIHHQQNRAKITNVPKAIFDGRSTVLGKTGFIPNVITISSVPDLTNELTLTQKSIYRLLQRGLTHDHIKKFYKRKSQFTTFAKPISK